MKCVTRWMFAACLSVAGVAYAQAEGPKIRFKHWSAPGRYTITIRMRMTQEITVNDVAQPPQDLDQLLVMETTVGEPSPDGDRSVAIAFRRIKQVIKQGPRTLTYDSAGGEGEQNPQLAKAFAPMLKLKLNVVLAADGMVKQVSGFESFWDEMLEQEPAAAKMIRSMQKQLGDAVVKELMNKSRDLVPAAGVAVGQEWTSETKLPIPFVGDADLVQNCKLAKVEMTDAGRVAVIDYTGSVTVPEDAKVSIGEVSLTFSHFSVEQKGTMRLNADTGVPGNSELKQIAMMSMTGKDRRGRESKIGLQQEATTVTTVESMPATATKPAKPKAAG